MPPRTVVLTAAAALFACWFVYTRPLAALAIVGIAVVVLGCIGFVGTVGYFIFGWRTAPATEVELDDDEADAAGAPW
jgi:hypothetical protein